MVCARRPPRELGAPVGRPLRKTPRRPKRRSTAGADSELVLTPLGAAVAAAIASAGAARTLMAQSEIAQRNRFEDEERLLWSRFDRAAHQFARHEFAIQAAGAYALAGLADDWIRHNKRLNAMGSERRDETAEAETIVDILCAHLRRNTHLIKGLSEAEAAEAALVNEAIISQLATHLWRPATDSDSSPPGLWARKEFKLDLRGTDLNRSNWSQLDLRDATLYRADLYDADLSGCDLSRANLRRVDIRKADLKGADLTDAKLDNIIFNEKTIWPYPDYPIPSPAWGIPDWVDYKQPDSTQPDRKRRGS